MALRGKGMLIVYTDIAARDERDFNEWYNREHIDERSTCRVPTAGRRYVSLKGLAEIPRDLRMRPRRGPRHAGLSRVACHQTPWTQAVMARFKSFKRMTVRIQIDRTNGEGGAITTVRFVPIPALRRPLVDWLNETALPRAIERPGMVGAAVAENDLEVANAPMRSGSMDRPKADEVEWVVMLEGSDPAATSAAARLLFKASALKPFGVTQGAGGRHLPFPVRQRAVSLTLRTPRLTLRSWHAKDRAAFAQLNADPEVARDLGGPLTRGRSDAKFDATSRPSRARLQPVGDRGPRGASRAMPA
jgi:hypothetical protein